MPFSKEDMNHFDKRKVLESFVENDAALSLLLDFIASKHMKSKPDFGPIGLADQVSNGGMSSHYGSALMTYGAQSPPSQIMVQQSQQLMGDGSQTVYSTQYNQHLKNLQNQASKLSDGVDPKITGQAFQLQSQANSLLKNHMLSNSFMNQGGEK